ncbi:hypothetical protein, conserved [Angomonas deanei]|uniref:Uncharacterized protein n=1 Tax=Angomonas deanei TaxID=59799 RepID=A0A7G2C270_9TRYP|nr:hypothetical protein, conserved [Angomonas deanei]
MVAVEHLAVCGQSQGGQSTIHQNRIGQQHQRFARPIRYPVARIIRVVHHLPERIVDPDQVACAAFVVLVADAVQPAKAVAVEQQHPVEVWLPTWFIRPPLGDVPCWALLSVPQPLRQILPQDHQQETHPRQVLLSVTQDEKLVVRGELVAAVAQQ